MKHISHRIITQILIYTAVIIVIFMIQFTKGKTFSYVIGSMSVSGRHDVATDGTTTPLLPINVVANGLNFYASEQHPIVATINDENVNLTVLRYQNSPNSFTIECSHDVAIIFTMDKRGDVELLSIKAIFPENVKTVQMPWQTTQTAKIEIKSRKSFVKYSKQSFEFIGNFGFNALGIIDANVTVPHITLTKKTPVAVYKTFIPAKGVNLESIATMPNSTLNDFKAIKEEFISASLNVFNDEITNKRYNESLLAAYLAEMCKRNMYKTGINKVPNTVLPKSKRSWLTATFYGNIIQNYEELLKNEKNERSYLSNLISEKNFSVFEFPHLITYLVDRNSSMMIDDLQEIVTKNNIKNITIPQALGILEAYLEYSQLFPNQPNIFEKVTDTCSRKITEALTAIDEKLYLTKDSDTIDSLLTLRAVEILNQYKNEKPEWEAVCYKLYTSLLSFSGKSASLPAVFNITTTDNVNKNIMVNDEIILTPSKLYPYVIQNNKWYPHAESLAKQTEPGIWAWTSAEKITVQEYSKDAFVFYVEATEGVSHYLVLRNIKPFHTIIMYNLNYKSAPNFEIFDSSGYVYNEQTNTLYLKIKHKQDREKITLLFK